MGYDMYIEEKVGLASDQVYYRLSISGMGRTLEIMGEYDMLVLVGSPRWPRPEEFGCEGGKDQNGWVVYNETTPQWAAYEKALRKIRDGHCDREEPGIPIYKLGSNDGWLVTPLEIEGALLKYEENGPLTPEQLGRCDWWDGWLKYLKLAKRHGGFRVH